MKKHSGMRPHDIVVLLKIAAKKDDPWFMKDLSHELGISASEISESLNRSAIAGLISKDKKQLMRLAILDFLAYGLRYVFPAMPGGMVKGIPTAHSAHPLADSIRSNTAYVWAYPEGKVRGESVAPLHANLPQACAQDQLFYEYMALCDALRVGKAREKKLAIAALKERLC